MSPIYVDSVNIARYVNTVHIAFTFERRVVVTTAIAPAGRSLPASDRPETHPFRESVTAARVSGALLVFGSLLFLGGGSRHPRINYTLGPVGSDQFFLAFAQHVTMHANWEAFHAMILVGPVIWALSSPGIESVLPRRGAPLWSAARMSLGIAATLWAIAFVLDGFNAPIFARAIAAAPSAEAQRELLFDFRISASTMAHLGLISWTLLSLAFGAYGAGLIASARRTAWKTILGATGILIGAWPFIEIARRDFLPGPFTSPLWTATALVTGIWIALFGITIALEKPSAIVKEAGV
jgi:hypothetical protein